MGKKLVAGLVIALTLIGMFTVYSVGRQLTVDYQNFRKMVIWVAQKQQEELARQRALQQAPKPQSVLPEASEVPKN